MLCKFLPNRPPFYICLWAVILNISFVFPQWYPVYLVRYISDIICNKESCILIRENVDFWEHTTCFHCWHLFMQNICFQIFYLNIANTNLYPWYIFNNFQSYWWCIFKCLILRQSYSFHQHYKWQMFYEKIIVM